jgi:hypothetical protein
MKGKLPSWTCARCGYLIAGGITQLEHDDNNCLPKVPKRLYDDLLSERNRAVTALRDLQIEMIALRARLTDCEICKEMLLGLEKK